MLAPKPPPRMSNQEFLAFLDSRPDGERWELIDGVPIEMNRPGYNHEILIANLA